MDRLHARYPFLEAAREAVEEAEVDLAELVAEGDPAVERAMERIETCLHEGTVGQPHRDARTELLSYPVARVVVSLVDQPVLVRRYAAAEARTARERLAGDLEDDGLRSTGDPQLDLRQLLAEFDLSGQVQEVSETAGDVGTTGGAGAGGDDGADYCVDVGPYLRLTGDLDGEDWRLVARPLADGEVPVTREELLVLLREAIRERVADGLPFEVPDAVASGLTEEVESIERLLADRELPAPEDVDAVVPALFPPCVAHLVERARAGEELPHHSRFALVSFLAAVGLEPPEVAAVFERDADVARYQAEHVGGGYPLPSCETMQALGDCVNMDERCETIDHPLSYYAEALDDADDPAALADDDEGLAERLS